MGTVAFGQARVVFAPRHHHALFHAPLQLPLHGIKPAGKASAGVFPRQLLFHQCFDVLTGSVRVTPRPGAFQSVQFTFRLVAAEPFAHKSPGFRYQFVHLQRLQILLFALLIFPFDTTAADAITATSETSSAENSAGVKVISVGMLQPICGSYSVW
ncbi:Uncharacterised protein [Salmonella enterica subsp. indica]|uniref:Uncharacterized protein n=1 Tax=Salmonella enterica subsp. indica TaxID=59207 RepID=A0A379YKQ6_SALER|nr:Uncharacterised protein [Salmonella enterica subsp. indica]